MWPQMTFQREMMQQRASIAYLIMILGELGRSDAY